MNVVRPHVKLFIGMLVDGDPQTARVCLGPQQIIHQLRMGGLRIEHVGQDFTYAAGNTDVSRGRDRLARMFLDSDCTHMLWWDEDVVPKDPHIIGRMLATGWEVVGAPYPKKRYQQGRDGSGGHLAYPYRVEGRDGESERKEVVRGCIEVHSLPFGFTITSRSCLERMWRAYDRDRWYVDVHPTSLSNPTATGQMAHHRSVGLFDLVYTEEVDGPDGKPWRVKLSEDFSFCHSWRALGGKVHMYIGDGSGADVPLGHVGNHIYAGGLEDVFVAE